MCIHARTQVAKAGVDTLTVGISGVTAVEANSLVVKICYDSAEIVDKPWRKKNDVITKNKQCKQTAVESAALVTGVATDATSVEIEVPGNTAPSHYSIQVLQADADGGFTQWGSSGADCMFTVETYDRLPTALVGTMSFFIAFSIVSGLAGYMIDAKRQNAAAAQYA